MEIKSIGQNDTQNKTFLTVLADGNFHQKVQQGTAGAVERTIEKDDLTQETVYELLHKSVTGVITNAYIEDGQFGKNLKIEIDNDGIISLNMKSQYAESLLRRLPNINVSEPVSLSPYNFSKDSKKFKGISVSQNGEKLQDHYFNAEKKSVANGLPEKDADEEWDEYFTGVRKFLTQEFKRISEKNGWGATMVGKRQTGGQQVNVFGFGRLNGKAVGLGETGSSGKTAEHGSCAECLVAEQALLFRSGSPLYKGPPTVVVNQRSSR